MPTNRFVIDASAWIEYLDGTETGKSVIKIAEDNSTEVFTSAATVAEVVSKFLRANKDVKIAFASINNLTVVFNLTQEISMAAGQIHAAAKKTNKNFGMLDAFVVATARKFGAKILTCDSDFRGFKEAVII